MAGSPAFLWLLWSLLFVGTLSESYKPTNVASVRSSDSGAPKARLALFNKNRRTFNSFINHVIRRQAATIANGPPGISSPLQKRTGTQPANGPPGPPLQKSPTGTGPANGPSGPPLQKSPTGTGPANGPSGPPLQKSPTGTGWANGPSGPPLQKSPTGTGRANGPSGPPLQKSPTGTGPANGPSGPPLQKSPTGTGPANGPSGPPLQKSPTGTGPANGPPGSPVQKSPTGTGMPGATSFKGKLSAKWNDFKTQSWSGKLGTISNGLSVVSGLVSAVTGIVNVVNQFRSLAHQREQMKIKEETFNEEMRTNTLHLCSLLCVSDWSAWGRCSSSCGGGTTTRNRTRLTPEICNGVQSTCSMTLAETAMCNEDCPNRGISQNNGTCLCKPGFSGTCCDNEAKCKLSDKPKHGQVTGDLPAKFRGMISYSCSPGFALVGNKTRECQADEHWDTDEPQCKIIFCPKPEAPSEGRILNEQTSYQYGQEVIYECDNGYVLGGPERRQCKTIHGGSTGTWTAFTPLCIPVSCDQLGDPMNGRAQGTEFTFNHSLTFSCKEGFRLVGSATRQCLEKGKWSGHEAKCERITCDKPLVPKNGRLMNARRTYSSGVVARYECREGFQLEGNATSKCVADNQLSHLGPGGKWSNKPPICKPKDCGDPGDIKNGAKDGSVFHYPNNVSFKCFHGYILQGAAKLQCGKLGKWSARPPTCHACKNDTFKANSDGPNECTPCPENTHTTGEASTSAQQCVCNSGWTGQPGGPCTEMVCPVPAAPNNGQVNCTGNKYTDKCEFTCSDGYKLDKGSGQRICLDTGKWTGADAQCKACPLNTYNSDQRSCLPCPRNSHTMSVASMKEDCKCDQGYEATAEGQCADINECASNGGQGPCEDVCQNTVGSYVCQCSVPGYVIDMVDRNSCKRENFCRNLTQNDFPANGYLICHWHSEQNSQRCWILCNRGYESSGKRNNYEYCGPDTGYKWSHEAKGDVIAPCLEISPNFKIKGNASYTGGNCAVLIATAQKQELVRNSFTEMLNDKGICIFRTRKICNTTNVGVQCKTTQGGIAQNDDQLEVTFELDARMKSQSECDATTCNMLRIQPHQCQTRCVPRYKQYLKALMLYSARSIKNLFANNDDVNFNSVGHAFEYIDDSLHISKTGA